MKPRPTIFLSGVSGEFGSFRDAVEHEIKMKGCFAENQPGFPPDYRTVEEMLRRKLHEADAVIHIAGFRFGAEPKGRPADAPRRSYTQMEFDIARAMQKPVYLFLSKDATVRDDAKPDEKPEDAEAIALQLTHRQTVQSTNHLRYFFKDQTELRQLAAEIPPVAAFDFRPDISRIIKYAPSELIGREEDLKVLDDAWLKVRRAELSRPHILTFVALGGEGKTSLLAKWAAELAAQDWPGCDAAFAWSFYSQGTRDQVAASSDLFLKEALTFFGDDADKAFAASPAGAFEKGQRLARIVSQRRSLLILDGLEPLQYAPASPTPGELKDSGIAVLLKELAAASQGLCVITTRYSIPDLRTFWQTTVLEVSLLRLSREAGVHLLKTLGVTGALKEFETLVEDVRGHALTLNLLGTYLRDAHAGDIRKKDLVNLEEADSEEQGGHAFRVMAAYEREFHRTGDKGRRSLAVLRLLGLFDRPISFSCLGALLQVPAIPGLTEPLVGLSEADRNLAFQRLENARLLTVNRDGSERVVTLDAHPLLREYFASRLKRGSFWYSIFRRSLQRILPGLKISSSTWRVAQRRLFKHLCSITKEVDRPTLEDLQPLYQAVAHGCQAGLWDESWKIYDSRIRSGQSYYSMNALGAFSSDLGALSCFLEPASRNARVRACPAYQDEVLYDMAVCLRAITRLNEAQTAASIALALAEKRKNFAHAANVARFLSALDLALGKVPGAVEQSATALQFAEVSKSSYELFTSHVSRGVALHQAGREADAFSDFRQSDALVTEIGKIPGPRAPEIKIWQGFRRTECEFGRLEAAAWRAILPRQVENADGELLTAARNVLLESKNGARNAQSQIVGPLYSALDRLKNARVALFVSCLDKSLELRKRAQAEMVFVVRGMETGGRQDYRPIYLLPNAWLKVLDENDRAAKSDLDEAWEISERGPMRLFLADIHLHRARLFFRKQTYPWEKAKNRHGEIVSGRTAKDDLDDAEYLINDCEYHRRDEELADARAVILGASDRTQPSPDPEAP